MTSMYPGVTQDAEHPTRQACVGSELLGPRQRALDGDLHEVVGIVRITGEGAGKAPQAWQKVHDLFSKLLQGCVHASHNQYIQYGAGRHFLPWPATFN